MPILIHDQNQPDHPGGEEPRPMRIFLAYENLSSALWAAEAFTSLLRKSSAEAETQLLPWSFSTLSDPATQARATAAAAEADLIVIAASSSFRLLPAFVESWLTKCLSLRLSPKTVVAALFGHARVPEGADSQRLLTVKRLAEKAGCQFLSPFPTETI